MNSFITIKDNVQAELIEKKSKFLANLFYVESVKEAEEIISNTKKKYFDARHNCIAYRVMEDRIVEKSSDDGEPSGTAGAPMLNILQKNNLCNVLIIVTRYFGGILLGTGGLVRAYSDSLIGAIEKADKVIQVPGIEIEVTLNYNQLEKFQYYCRINEIEIIKMDYSDNIICRLVLEESKNNKLLDDFNNKSLNIMQIETFGKAIVTKSKIK